MNMTVTPMRYLALLLILSTTPSAVRANCVYELPTGGLVETPIPQFRATLGIPMAKGAGYNGTIRFINHSPVFEPDPTGVDMTNETNVQYDGHDPVLSGVITGVISETHGFPSAFYGVAVRNSGQPGEGRLSLYSNVNMPSGTTLFYPGATLYGITSFAWTKITLRGGGAAEFCSRNQSLTVTRNGRAGVYLPNLVFSFPISTTVRLSRHSSTSIAVTPGKLDFGAVSSPASASLNLSTRVQAISNTRYDLTYSYTADNGPQHDLTANGQQLPVTYSNLVTDAQGNNDHVVSFGLRSTAPGAVNGRLLVTAQIR